MHEQPSVLQATLMAFSLVGGVSLFAFTFAMYLLYTS